MSHNIVAIQKLFTFINRLPAKIFKPSKLDRGSFRQYFSYRLLARGKHAETFEKLFHGIRAHTYVYRK